MAISGSCLCGTLRYEIEGPFTIMMNCHCSMCRKHHGAPFATFAGASTKGFRWLGGEDAVQEYPSSEHGKRSFCRTCGSVAPLFMTGMVVVPVGTLDSDPGMRVTAHIFVGSKAAWYEITDTLPQHDEYPPEFAGATSVPRPTVTAEAGKTHGSCLCGDVAYEMTGAPMFMFQCYCKRCRKGRSAMHGQNVFYKADQFRWVRGSELVADFKVPDARFFTVSFCKHCGGAVPTVSVARGIVIVPTGPLDTDPGMRPMANIFVESKVPWHDITDSMPQFPEAPPLPPR
jgi:hypothetical protein